MPRYTIRNKTTKKVEEVEMTYSDFKKLLEDDNIEQIFDRFPGMVSPYSVGRLKTDTKFRDRMNLVKSEMSGTTVRTENISEV